MLKMQLKSLHSPSFFLYNKFLKKTFDKCFDNYTFFVLPKKKKKITLLSSPHINKVAREQFEITFYKSVYLIPISKNLIDFKFLLLNKPKNIGVKIKIY